MTVYINMRTSQGVETVDQFDKPANQSLQAFREYVREMVKEYHLAGMDVYRSKRACKDW